MFREIHKIKKGFTIIETMIAISILVLAIAGATRAIQTGISAYILSKEQITAFYLAQEGFEQIRNIRDENGLKGQSWLTGVSASSGDPCYFGNACRVDTVGSTHLTRCGSPGSCPVLKQNSSTGFFGYTSGWTDTPYKREVVLTQINSNEISVKVTVSWSKGIISRQFSAKENLFNWQQ